MIRAPIFTGGIHKALTNASIEYQDCHVGLHRLPNLHHLREQLALLPMSSTRIYDDHLKPLLLEFGDTLCGDGNGVRFGVRAIVCNFGFRRGLTRLVECTGAECVSADDT